MAVRQLLSNITKEGCLGLGVMQDFNKYLSKSKESEKENGIKTQAHHTNMMTHWGANSHPDDHGQVTDWISLRAEL